MTTSSRDQKVCSLSCKRTPEQIKQRALEWRLERKRKKEEALYNHKIKKIEIINLTTPVKVYDIAVDDSHNFLLDTGNIVHNSYWGQEILKHKRMTQHGRQEY